MASKLEVTRGTTFVITHTYQKDGIDSTDGATLFFTVKEAEYDGSATDTTALISKTVVMSGATNEIEIEPADTSTLTPGKYFYDLKVKETTGAIYKVDEGRFVLDGSPTNRLT